MRVLPILGLLLASYAASPQMSTFAQASYSGSINPYYGFTENFPWGDGDLTSRSAGIWQTNNWVRAELYVTSHIVATSTGSTCPNYCFVRWNGPGGWPPANQSTQVTFIGIGTSFLGPAVRVDILGTQTGYAALCSTTYGSPACEIVKVVDGTYSALTSAGSTITTNSLVKLTVTGTNSTVLTVYVNGSSYLTYTDTSSPITSGTWGLGDSLTNADTSIRAFPQIV